MYITPACSCFRRVTESVNEHIRTRSDSQAAPLIWRFRAIPSALTRARYRPHVYLRFDLSGEGTSLNQSSQRNWFAELRNAGSTLKTERPDRNYYRPCNAARADVFDYVERCYKAIRLHSTLNHLSLIDFTRHTRTQELVA